jgi:tetratricopeptide (TPR) repeat protein
MLEDAGFQSPGCDEPPETASASQPRWRSWVLAVVVIVAVCVGLTVLVRMTPPANRVVQDRARRAGQVTLGGTTRDGPSTSPLFPPAATPQQRIDVLKRISRDLLDRFPEDADTLALGGHIYQAYGDTVAAARCWNKCLQLHPQFSEAWGGVGWAASVRGDYVQAADYLRKAFAADPRLPDNYIKALAESLMHLGKPQEAVDFLEKSRSIRGLAPEHALLLAQAYLQLKDFGNAKNQLERALSVYPSMKEAHYMLATALTRLGQPDAAAKHRQEYAKLEQHDSDADAMSRPTRRAADMIDDRPLMGTFCLDAGTIYAKHGSLDEAERHWLAAAAMNPRDNEPRRVLARLYDAQGRYEELSRILQETPTSFTSPVSP